jgi:hypothetical protein
VRRVHCTLLKRGSHLWLPNRVQVSCCSRQQDQACLIHFNNGKRCTALLPASSALRFHGPIVARSRGSMTCRAAAGRRGLQRKSASPAPYMHLACLQAPETPDGQTASPLSANGTPSATPLEVTRMMSELQARLSSIYPCPAESELLACQPCVLHDIVLLARWNGWCRRTIQTEARGIFFCATFTGPGNWHVSLFPSCN